MACIGADRADLGHQMVAACPHRSRATGSELERFGIHIHTRIAAAQDAATHRAQGHRAPAGLARGQASATVCAAASIQQTFGGVIVGEYVRHFIEQQQRDTCYADIAPIARQPSVQPMPPVVVLSI